MENFKIYEMVCVLRGSFSPAIFSPLWLVEYDLVRKTESERAEIGVIHRNITVFSVSGIHFQVTPDMFSLTTQDQSKFEMMRDLVVGIFSVLSSTPITMLGINTQVHIQFPKLETRNAILSKLVPLDTLKKAIGDADLTSFEVSTKNSFAKKGYIKTKIEPSLIVDNGIFFLVNNHHDFEEKPINTEAVELVKEKWLPIMTSSAEVINKIVKV